MNSSCLKALFSKYRRAVVAISLAVTLLAVWVTRDLPTPAVYEARYEVRLLDYSVHADTLLRTLPCMPRSEVCDYLSQQVGSREGIDIWADNTQKITLRVRHQIKDTAEHLAADLYARLCDTATRYGTKLYAPVALVYRAHLDSLKVLPVTEEREALMQKYDHLLAEVEIGNGHCQMVTLLNTSDAGTAHKTLNRWLIVLLSFLASVLLTSFFVFLRYWDEKRV